MTVPLTIARAADGDVITRRLSFAIGTEEAASWLESMSGSDVTPGLEKLSGRV